MNTAVKRHSDAIQALFAQADREKRDLTADERRRAQGHVEQAQAAKSAKDMDRSLGYFGSRGLSRPSGLGGEAPGDKFVASAGYKAIADPATRGARWSSGAVELQTKDGELYEGDLTPGTGGALVQPDVRPGIVPILAQPLKVAGLPRQSTTDSNRVTVVVESVATSGAAGVEEGGSKPPSTLEFDQTDEPVRKIATLIGPISDELLSDAPSLATYINGRLSLFVEQELDDQLLNGAGSGTDLVGLLDRVPSENQDLASDAAAPTPVDNIYAAVSKAQESYLDPDAVIVNPSDWAFIRLIKDQNENYIGGSPFSNTGSEPGESLFGRKVVVTNAIAAGTALVGAFASGTELFRRGGLVVEVSNSHDDWFKSDQVAIRAETRLALAVHRPEALATASLYAS